MSFDPRIPSADSESVSSKADEYHSLLERLTGQSEEQLEEFSKTSTSFSDMLADDIKSSGDINYAHWKEACMACVVAAEATEQWSESLNTYEEKISGLQYLVENVAPTLSNEVQVPYAADSPPPRQQYLKELQRLADEAWDDLEDEAEECSDHIKGGTDPDNVSSLMGGRLDWLPNNIMGASMPVPVDADQGDLDGEELQEMLESGEISQERYDALMATLTALTGRAEYLKERAEHANEDEEDLELNPHEVKYLEAFFESLEDIDSPDDYEGSDGVISLPSLIEENIGDESQRSELLQKLGDGLLTLSNESIGGSEEKLPESVRNAAMGPTLARHENGFEGYRQDDEIYGSDLANLADLLEQSSEETEGGVKFSQNITMSLGGLLESFHTHSDTDEMRTSLEAAGGLEALETLLDISTENDEANRAIFTGQYETDELSHEEYSKLIDESLRGFLTFGESFDQSDIAEDEDSFESYNRTPGGLTALFDWLSDEEVNSNPETRALAAESMGALTLFMADPEEHGPLMGTVPSSISRDAADSLSDAFAAHIHTFSSDVGINGKGDVVSADGYQNRRNVELDSDGEFAFIPPEERTRFLEIIMTDQSAAVDIHSDTIRFVHGEAVNSVDSGDLGSSSLPSGNLAAIVESALENEADHRNLSDEDLQQDKENMWDFAAGAITNSASGADDLPSRFVPFVGPTLSVFDDILKDQLLNTDEEHNPYSDPNGSLDLSSIKIESQIHMLERMLEEHENDPEVQQHPFMSDSGEIELEHLSQLESDGIITGIDSDLLEQNPKDIQLEDLEGIVFDRNKLHEVINSPDEGSDTTIGALDGVTIDRPMSWQKNDRIGATQFDEFTGAYDGRREVLRDQLSGNIPGGEELDKDDD
ncbi:hypothetical protein IDM40_19805 [Nocardiopsis sp. HNM0947]|uniref:TPR repeat domain-containing protein n=1 Tax=Nocardiopsis coralli TaxID=2772213 RepID=A0ABR9PAQ4_9ACTN|nr:hypothetical protein [Nocardiopsis coralli]MBE3000919.1 hypothetical protein [Nocardiopsis coralli]